MKDPCHLLLIACIVVLSILIFFAPQFGWQLRAWLSGSAFVAPGDAGDAAAVNLAAENESLRAALAVYSKIAAQMPTSSAGYARAIVYSRYPMNFKNELLVNAGARDGAVMGKAVLFQGIFIGTISKVFSDTSIISTIFDNGFRMPVRIGSQGSDGLLIGGAAPSIVSIAKTASVMPGDIVYTAGQGAPYGLPLAIIAATSTSGDHLFAEAALNFAYDINAVQTVLIAK